MKQKLSKLVALVCTIFIISSCSKDDPQYNGVNAIKEAKAIKKVKSIEDEKKITLKELGYNSYEDMLNNGWEVVHKTKQNELFKPKARQFGVRSSVIKERLTMDQVRDLGYSDYALKNLYYSVYNKWPDGVSVNDYGTSGVVYPLITQRYGWYAYVQTGTPKITEIPLERPEYITTTTWVTNNSNVTDKLAKNITYSESKQTSWTVSGTVGMKVGGKVGIPLVAEGSVEVSVGLTAGGGSETTITRSYSDTYTADLPPFSKRQIIFVQKVAETAFKYEFPVNITGYVGLNFPSRVNGHYFWGQPASLLLKGKKDKQLGTINVQKKLEVEIIAGPVIPL